MASGAAGDLSHFGDGQAALGPAAGRIIGALLLLTVLVADSYYLVVIARIVYGAWFSIARGFAPAQRAAFGAGRGHGPLQYAVALGVLAVALATLTAPAGSQSIEDKRAEAAEVHEQIEALEAEYDVNYKQMRRVGMGLEVGADRATISAGWSRVSTLAADAADRETRSNTLRGSTQLQLVPGSVDRFTPPDSFVQMPPSQTKTVQKLRYLSEPLPHDVLIAGPSVLTLYAEIDQDDLTSALEECRDVVDEGGA